MTNTFPYATDKSSMLQKKTNLYIKVPRIKENSFIHSTNIYQASASFSSYHSRHCEYSPK